MPSLVIITLRHFVWIAVAGLGACQSTSHTADDSSLDSAASSRGGILFTGADVVCVEKASNGPFGIAMKYISSTNPSANKVWYGAKGETDVIEFRALRSFPGAYSPVKFKVKGSESVFEISTKGGVGDEIFDGTLKLPELEGGLPANDITLPCRYFKSPGVTDGLYNKFVTELKKKKLI